MTGDEPRHPQPLMGADMGKVAAEILQISSARVAPEDRRQIWGRMAMQALPVVGDSSPFLGGNT